MTTSRLLVGLFCAVVVIYTLNFIWAATFQTIFAESDINPASLGLFCSNFCCKWDATILLSPTGQYTLNLCSRIMESPSDLRIPVVPAIEEAKIRVNGSHNHVNFEDLVKIPDSEWLKTFDPSVYNLYPQSLPIREMVQRVIHGQSLYEAPIFNPLIRFLRIPSNVCSPLTTPQGQNKSPKLNLHDVVLIYKSAVYNFGLRKTLRNLYHFNNSKINIHLIFSIGLPRSAGGNVFQRDGFNVTLRTRAGWKLLQHSISPHVADERLSKEMRKHTDLLIGDYEDTYFNLSLKLFHTFQWAARFCRHHKPIFVFIDDDYAVNTPRLLAFVSDLTPEQRDTLSHGYKMRHNPTVRPEDDLPQWAYSKREVPWPFHPPTHLGIYSVWSYRHVHDMALAMHFTKPMVSDDTWLGMVQFKLGLNFTRLPGMFVGGLPTHSAANCSHLFFAPINDFTKRGCTL